MLLNSGKQSQFLADIKLMPWNELHTTDLRGNGKT
jgi:hypothetical protein